MKTCDFCGRRLGEFTRDLGRHPRCVGKTRKVAQAVDFPWKVGDVGEYRPNMIRGATRAVAPMGEPARVLAVFPGSGRVRVAMAGAEYILLADNLMRRA